MLFKKNKLPVFLLIIIFTFIPMFSFAGNGEAPAEFLSFLPGTQSLSMGGAFTVISNDVTSVFWNPANMFIKEKPVQVGVGYNKLPFYTHCGYFSFIYSHTDESLWSLGLAGIYGLSDDKVYEVSSTGEVGDQIDNQYWIGMGAFSIALNEFGSMRLGISAKVFNHMLGNAKAYGGAVDIAFDYFIAGIIDVSFIISNIGAISWDSRDEMEPLHNLMKIGIGFVQGDIFGAALQVNKDLWTKEWPKFKVGLWFRLFTGEVRVSHVLRDLPVNPFAQDFSLNEDSDNNSDNPESAFPSGAEDVSPPEANYVNLNVGYNGYTAGMFTVGLTFFFYGITLDVGAGFPTSFYDEVLYASSIQYEF